MRMASLLTSRGYKIREVCVRVFQYVDCASIAIVYVAFQHSDITCTCRFPIIT